MGTKQVSVAWALGGVSFQTEEGWESQAPCLLQWSGHGMGEEAGQSWRLHMWAPFESM